MVGVSDGDSVGEIVGCDTEGLVVGYAVGDAVGDCDGEEVG